jgi:hypothetical protein
MLSVYIGDIREQGQEGLLLRVSFAVKLYLNVDLWVMG